MSKVFSINEIKKIFDELKKYSTTSPDQGTTRLAYSTVDQQAHQFLMDKAAEHGFDIRQDTIGNIFIRLQGAEPDLPAVGTGSHIDTVPCGGNYDGVVGVLSGLYAMSKFKPGQLKRSLETIIFRAEESSRFGFSCIGSKVLTGRIDRKNWKKNRDSSGVDFFQAIEQAGYASKLVSNKNCELPNDYFSSFIEVHIEQGKCLEVEHKTVGIVDGIAAPTRFCITIKGQADHSGATPMYQRKDALVVAASLITDINRVAYEECRYGTVGTVGKIDIFPNSMNVIPGEVALYVDIRGIEPASIQRVEDYLLHSIEKLRRDKAMAIDVREISREEPVKMNAKVCEVIETLCREKNIAHMTMLSGAGHDSMNMAKKFPTAMIFIPSKNGVSHHVGEFSRFSDIEVAADLLKEALAVLANR